MTMFAYALLGLATYVIATAVYVILQAAVGVAHGVAVKETSVNVGPTLWRGTLWSAPFYLKAIPLGGCTSFHADDADDDDDESLLARARDSKPIRVRDLPPLGRLQICLVGPLSSFLLSGTLLAVAVWIGAPTLEVVSPDDSTIRPCSVPGLRITDEPTSWRSQWELIGATVGELGQRLVLFRPLDQWGGPLSWFLMCGAAARDSLAAWFSLVGIFLFGVGLMNLLPIPVLNGFHVLCLLFELLVGRPLAENVLFSVNKLGLGFMLVISVRLLSIDLRWLLTNIFLTATSMNKKTIADLKDLKGKRVLVRVDFNVPLDPACHPAGGPHPLLR